MRDHTTFPARAPSPLNLHMEPHDININDPVSSEASAPTAPSADDQISQPRSPIETSAKQAPCPVKPEGGAPGGAATTIPQVSLDEVHDSSRRGFWIPTKQTTLGLQLNKTSYDPSAPIIQDDADRRAFSERAAANSVTPNWTEVEGVVELALRPELGLTLPGLPGVNVGFAVESLLQYRNLHPYPTRASAAAAPAPASPAVKLPTSAAAALKMPRGSELELRGRGTIKGSLGVGIGHGSVGPVRLGVGVNAGVTQKFTGELAVRVKRLGDSFVRVDITDIDSASTNISAQVTAGLSLDNSIRNLGEGLIISAVRNGAPEELETILNIVVNANINARLAYETGVETREISAVVLDLNKPQAREAYDQLVALDTTRADELAEQEQSGVWFAQARDVENTEQFDASVSLLGTKLLLFRALDQARAGVFEDANGRTLTYHDASYEQETVNVVSGDKKIAWQGVSLEDPKASTPTEAYFRLNFSATDRITYQEEVDSIFRFAKALKLDTSKGDSQLETRGFAEKLWEDSDDTQVDIDLYFTPAYAETSSSSDWETIANVDGFVTKRKSVAGSNVFAFRGETVANVSIGKILKIFLDSSTRKNWVAMFGGSGELNVVSPMDRTYWIRFNTPFPTSDRDYVLHAVANADEASRVFTTNIESVDHADRGENDCCVRGHAFGTFYRFEAIPGTNTTKVEVEVHTDPKGWIPGWLTNMIQKKWPKNTLNALIREASKATTSNHPDYAAWHDAAAEATSTTAAQ